jgi:hypothetical protein
VSKGPRALSLKRITIAFAAAESQPHSLDAIARLAADFEAEVSGVFIEDADMLRAARLPFAVEVCRATNVVRRVDSGAIERGLKKRAAAARKLIVEAAERSGARWSFEVVRRRKASAVLELAKATDVTVFAAATSFRLRPRVARDATRSATHQSSGGESIVVLVDRSAAAGRAIQIAHKLAEMRGIPVRAVLVAASKVGLDRLTERLQRTGRLDSSHIQGLCRPQFSAIAEAARVQRPAVVVLPIALVEGSTERVHALEQALENPILIVK